MLHGDAPAQSADAIDVARRNGLGVIDDPVQPFERHFAVDRLVDVERAPYGFVVGRVQAERPAVLSEEPHYRREIGLHARGHVGPRLEKILEVGRGVHEHFAGPVDAIQVVALARLHRFHPVGEIRELLSRALREEIGGEPHGQLLVPVQLGDDLVILRVVLKASAGVDHAGDAEPVQLAHELPGRIELLLVRQLRTLGECRIEDEGVGPRDQEARRIARLVAPDLARRRVGRVAGVADGAQGGAVEHRARVKVQHEHRGVGGGRVQLFQSRHALLGELKLGPAADHAHPMVHRRAPRLLAQHAHRVGERGHAVPPELEVVGEAPAYRVRVRIDQAGDHRAPVQLHHAGLGAPISHDRRGVAGRVNAAVLDRERVHERLAVVLRCDAAVHEEKIGGRSVRGRVRVSHWIERTGHPLASRIPLAVGSRHIGWRTQPQKA